MYVFLGGFPELIGGGTHVACNIVTAASRARPSCALFLGDLRVGVSFELGACISSGDQPRELGDMMSLGCLAPAC